MASGFRGAYNRRVTEPAKFSLPAERQGWRKHLQFLDSLSPRRRKLLFWTLGLFLFYTIAGFFILPPIIKAVAVKQLAKQLDREVSIRKVKLNPFAFSVTVRGLLIKDRDGQPFVSWDEVYVNFQLASFFGHAWIFKEVSTTKPFVRVQLNRDRTFNFSDLIAKFATNAPPQKPAKPAKPAVLRIDRLHVGGASASLTDLTPRTPFRRVLGPLDVTLVDFQTDPANKNPYSFTGTTDAGEQFAWSGHFYLDPLRSAGELSLTNLSLNKYAPLYQDFVRFEIKDGVVDARATYRFELGASNTVASVTNTSFSLHSFKLAEPDGGANLVELPEFSISGVSVDAAARRAEVGSIDAAGGSLVLRRGKDNALNVVELSQPAAGVTNEPGGILMLLRSVTNAVALLMNSTNTWTGTIHNVDFTNCALSLEDLVNSRPARLDLDRISFSARHISNLPGTNLTAALALRWNTNGTIRTDLAASFSPPTVDIQLALDRLELRPLDPYLEPNFNLFILDSKLSLDGRIRLRTTNAELPEVTFAGDVRLDDFSTVDGVLAEDLLKWSSVRITGIDANLNPPKVAIRELALDDVYARVVIETNATMNLMAALRLDHTNAPVAPAASAAEDQPKAAKKTPTPAAAQESEAATHAPAPSALPQISIATVVISNAQLRFTDRSLTPNVNVAIQQAGGTITGLSTKELQHADVALHALVDNVGPVDISGTINPFRQNLTNDIKITVKNVDLTPTSPYVGKFAGYRLTRGKLQLDLGYHIHERQLKAENLIVLDQFTFGEKVNSPDATKLPVRLAIAILKDRSGKIELNVPVEGSLDDPEFRVGKVIWHTLGNILTKIATSPFSVLGAIFGGKGEELSFQDFAAGSSELQPGGKEKLAGLVKGLYERPALQLDIEGSVDPDADRAGLRRGALEKQLRASKWMSLRKSEREATPADRVTLAPDERLYWLKKIYADALAKGDINAAVEAAVQSGSVSNAPPATPGGGRAASSRPDLSKGATVLMQHANVVPLTAAVPAAAAGAANPPPRRSEAEEMELRVLYSISISDSDFQALAAARAKAVREQILRSGKVEADRVFLVETQPGGVKMQGSRAYLQLK